MIRRLLAVWRGRNDIVAGRARYPGFLWRHLLKAARRPADPEPPSPCCCGVAGCDGTGPWFDHADPAPATVHLPAVLDADTAAVPAVDVHWSADRQPSPAPSTSDRPQVTMGEHEGATEEFAAVLAGMRHDLAHDGGSLDPDQREHEQTERAWEEAFAQLEGLLDLEARRSERRLNARLDAFAPGWDSQVCDPAFVGRSHCGRCVPDFDGVRELAGVIVLPAEPVDWATGEWPVLEVAG